MLIRKISLILIMCLLGSVLFGAELKMTDPAIQYITALELKADKAFKADNQTSLDFLTNSSIIYKVVKKEKSEENLLQYTDFVQRYNNNNAIVKFDEKRGMYYYHQEEITPLLYINDKLLVSLENDAKKKMKELLGDSSKNFVFANVETDWTKSIDNPTPRIFTQTYRFIRKINGRHIADNTAYVKIGYAGNSEVVILEIVNPELQPMPLKKMIDPAITAKRLQEYAANKNSVTSAKGEVKVDKIIAQKGTDTYYISEIGSEKYLIPHISIWSTFELADGNTFDRFINLSLDEESTPNLGDNENPVNLSRSR